MGSKVAYFSAAILSVMLGGCLSSFDESTEYKKLTYSQYQRKVGLDEVDPKGASDIYWQLHATRDSYDVRWRMNIPSAEFDALLAGMSKNMENSQYASYKGKALTPVRKSDTKDPAIPRNWPCPRTLPQAWWQPSKTSSGLRCVSWALQVSHVRAKGWYWLYDEKDGMLWIWHWNYQHADLAS